MFTEDFGPGEEDNSQHSGLLSLAFDCTAMVTELSQGFKLESQGEHESAVETMNSVEARIDRWLERLKDLDTGGVDRGELVENLEEAKEAVSFDD